MNFDERLRPGAFNLGLGALGGVVVGAVVWPFFEVAGYVVGVLAAVGAVLTLVVTSPRVVVEPGEPELGEGAVLRAGEARIGVEHLGDPEVLHADAMRVAMGPEADVRAYLCHRPWVRQGVRVPVTDPRDPTPYWLVSSRRPAELAAALRQGQAAHSEQTSWPPSS